MNYNNIRMVAVISFLTVLRMLTNAQTSCNRGVGRLVFEKLLDTELQGFDDDAYRERAPPLQVLERCKELCLQDRTSQESLVRTCASFDFVPGRRTALLAGAGGGSIDFEESVCQLSREQGRPEGIGTLTTNKYHSHFNEICLSSSRVSTECPEKVYVFERLEGFRFDQRDQGQEIYVKNRTDCEDRCLNEYGFVCRSATYDKQSQRCFLGRSTRRSNPESFVPDSNSVYLENTCLDDSRRCEGLPIFVKETNVEFAGPFGLEVVTATSEADCQRQCLQHRHMFCRSVQYDDRTHTCVLSDEDSISQPNDLRPTPGSNSVFAEIMCVNVNVGTASTPPIIGSFERVRNQRLTAGNEVGNEIPSRSLGECLEECLRQGPSRCMSALYNQRARSCRISQKSRNDAGSRLEFDQEFDYYEGILGSNLGEGNDTNDTMIGEPGGDFSYRNKGPNKLDRGNGFGGYGSSTNNVGSGTSYTFGANYGPLPAYGPGPGYQPPPQQGAGGYPPPPPGTAFGPSPAYGPAGPYGPSPGPGPAYGGSSWNTGGQWYGGAGGPPPPPGPSPGSPWANGYGNTGVQSGGGYGTGTGIKYSGSYGGTAGFGTGTGTGSGQGGYGIGQPGFGYGTGQSGYGTGQGGYGTGQGGFGTGQGGYGTGQGGLGTGQGGYGTGQGGYGTGQSGYGTGTGSNTFGSGQGTSGSGSAPAPVSTAQNPSGGGSGSSFSSSNFYGSYAPGRGQLIPGGGPPPPPPPPGGFGPEDFVLVGPRQRIRYFYVRRIATVNSLKDCEKECLSSKDFCRSFNFRNFFQENCELSDQDTGALDLNNPSYFDRNSEFDYYEKRSRGIPPPGYQSGGYPPYPPPTSYQGGPGIIAGYPGPAPPGPVPAIPVVVPGAPAPGAYPGFPAGFPTGGFPYPGGPGQLDVKQVCSEDGIEFTLTTPEGFYGRIYTYGYYDTCFFDGRGETVSVLKISRPDGFPRCGTVGYADYFTNIVVIQFNDFVQTGRDRKYNLTCTLYGPGETVVTSGVLNTGSVPIPLENLPAQNILASNVLLKIMYKGYPVQQIAVGDPLIFRLETRRNYGYGADIFAANVIAKDPYSGRVVQLIDPIGCPVDWYIFPHLDRARDGDGLEAQFNAFKIPDSNFLVFEATVRTCRGPCQPVNCNSPGRYNVVSFGRKKREISGNQTEEEIITQNDEQPENEYESEVNVTTTANFTFDTEPEQVRELLQVYLTRADIPLNQPGVEVLDVCISSGEYYALVVAIGIIVIVLVVVAIVSAACIRRYKLIHDKNATADSTSPSAIRPTGGPIPYFPSPASRYMTDNTRFDDPSEPIYTDPSLFERSRSSRGNALAEHFQKHGSSNRGFDQEEDQP